MVSQNPPPPPRSADKDTGPGFLSHGEEGFRNQKVSNAEVRIWGDGTGRGPGISNPQLN